MRPGSSPRSSGGVVWGLIVKFSDYEVGIVAWGIGFIAGTAVVFATRGGKGPHLQVIAVVSALLGILLGKYLSYAFVVQDQAEDAGVEHRALLERHVPLLPRGPRRRLRPLRPALGRLRRLHGLAGAAGGAPSRRGTVTE